MANVDKLWATTNTSSSSLSEIIHIATHLSVDPEAMGAVSIDFGREVRMRPAAVFYPSSVQDVTALVKLSHNLSPGQFGVAARGRGHSLKGQAMADQTGVVVQMSSLNTDKEGGGRIRVSHHHDHSSPNSIDWSSLGFCGYVDAGGEQLWVDVLIGCLKERLTPVSWTDYLYLTVGGTLSNGGISGQSFRHGPQIYNVIELDVVTGKGELITCSREQESELFNAVLGGLGQFGIITRARIPLQPAPKRVKWIRMLYNDFEKFARDQELLISNNKDVQGILNGINSVEGTLLMPKISSSNKSFFSDSDLNRISSQTAPSGIIYCLEVAKYYNPSYNTSIDEEVKGLLKGLSFLSDFIFTKDLSYIKFLNRVRDGEIGLQRKGLWDVPHPWMNLFIPKSQISEFNSAIFVNIIAKQDEVIGPMLIYPMNRDKWDDRMTTVIPEEDVFYAVGLLHSSTDEKWKALEEQNKEILRLCEEKGIMVKQYLPYCVEGLALSKLDFWRKHFEKQWARFEKRKTRFDPKMILSPGQRIFN